MRLTLEQKIQNALSYAIPYKGFCFRVLSQRFATKRDVASTKGSKIKGGRYNIKNKFGVLYLSCDSHTCLEEASRTRQKLAIDIANELPKTVIGFEVELTKVLNLTDSKIRQKLGIKVSDLTQTDWEKIQALGLEAITQTIGRLARQAGFEAILVPSSVWQGKNLDVFPDKLLPSSKISVVNSSQLP